MGKMGESGKPGKSIPASVVQRHNRVDDIWIVVDGQVYDMTRFAREHPGGSDSEAILVIPGPGLMRGCSHLCLRRSRSIAGVFRGS